jgi:hypothetical protein
LNGTRTRLETVETPCLLAGAVLLLAAVVVHGALPVLGAFAAGVTLLGLAYYCEDRTRRRWRKARLRHAFLRRGGFLPWPYLSTHAAHRKDELH